jgi:hypothetical protein
MSKSQCHFLRSILRDSHTKPMTPLPGVGLPLLYNQPSSNSHQTGMISCKGLEAMVSGPERTTKQSVGPDGASFLEDDEKKVCLNMKIERKPVTSDCADPPSPTRVTELPSELPLGRYFSSEEELERVLEELGLSDCRVQLDEQGIAIMPGPFHHRATRFLREEFDVWSKGTWGKWGKSDSDNIQLVQIQNGTTRKREPDGCFLELQEVYLERIQYICCQGNAGQ